MRQAQRFPIWLFLLMLAPGLTPASAVSQTEEVQTWRRFEIGNLVLKDLRPGRVTLGDREIIDGIEYRHFRLKASSGKFEYGPPPGTSVFKGNLTNVDIRGLFSRAQLPDVPPLFRVSPGQLDITLTPEVGRLEGFYGGVVELPGTRVWIDNPEEIRLTPTTHSGSLAFHSHPVRLRQIRLDLPLLGESLRTDLLSLDPDGQGGGRFLFSFADNSLRLVGGKFASTPFAPAAGSLSLPSFDVAFKDVATERIEAEVSKTDLRVSFRNLRAKVDTLFQFAGAPAPAIAKGSFKVAEARGTAPLATDRAALADLELERAAFAPDRDAAARTLAATAGSCQGPALTDSETTSFGLRGLPTPSLQTMRSIQTAAAGLAALPRIDLALHLPRERALGLLRNALGSLRALADTLQFGSQELVQCLSPSAISPQLAALLPIELQIHYGLSIDGRDLVVRPAVQLVRLPELQLGQAVLISALLQQLDSSIRQSAASLPTELRIPIPFQFQEAVDPKQLNGPGFTVTTDAVSAVVSLDGAALLVDEQGIHVIAALR